MTAQPLPGGNSTAPPPVSIPVGPPRCAVHRMDTSGTRCAVCGASLSKSYGPGRYVPDEAR
jgi:hypothetical protein